MRSCFQCPCIRTDCSTPLMVCVPCLALPCHGGAFYSIGAVLCFVFAAINASCLSGRTINGFVLFISGAVTAVPFLQTNPRAGRWLQTYLLISVLVPMYYFAGVSKIRYMGWYINFTGSWLSNNFKAAVSQSSFPALVVFIGNQNKLCQLLSWGNLAFEIALPLLTIFLMHKRWCRLRSAISFHIFICLAMGTNFMPCCFLALFCCDPFGLLKCRRKPEICTGARRQSPPDLLDWTRILLAITVLGLSFYVNIKSDVDHITNKIGKRKYRDPQFPFSEWKMYAKPLNPSFYSSACLVLLLLFAIVLKMLGASSKFRNL